MKKKMEKKWKYKLIIITHSGKTLKTVTQEVKLLC